MSPTRRQFLAAAGSAATITLAGCLGGGSSDRLDGPVASAPIPDAPSNHTYATMGTGQEPVVTYFGNWKCPACKQFDSGLLKDIVKEYVEPGSVSLQFRGLAYTPSSGEPFLGPDAPRATRAGLVVWNVEPESYWAYHAHVFGNQPSEQEVWATTEKLTEFAESAGVSKIEEVRSQIEANRYKKETQATTAAAADVGVTGTPLLLIDGQVVSPLQSPEKVRELLDKVSK